jgi:hypothetical protein
MGSSSPGYVYHKATIEVDEMDTVAARRSNGRGHASEWKRAASGGFRGGSALLLRHCRGEN